MEATFSLHIIKYNTVIKRPDLDSTYPSWCLMAHEIAKYITYKKRDRKKKKPRKSRNTISKNGHIINLNCSLNEMD